MTSSNQNKGVSEHASRIIRDLDLSSKLLPHRSEFHIGENCEPVLANGIELTDLIKHCHTARHGESLSVVLTTFLRGVKCHV